MTGISGRLDFRRFLESGVRSFPEQRLVIEPTFQPVHQYAAGQSRISSSVIRTILLQLRRLLYSLSALIIDICPSVFNTRIIILLDILKGFTMNIF